MAKTVTVDRIVKDVIGTLGKNTTHEYQRILHFCLEGLRNYNMDQDGSIVVDLFTLTDYKAVKLPDDFVDWVFIGLAREDKIIPMDMNEKMSLHFSLDECNNPVPKTTVTCTSNLNGNLYSNYAGYPYSSGNYFHNYINENGEHEGKLFGFGGAGSIGKFRVNEARNEIQFSSDVKTDENKIYMEYLSTGFDPTKDSMVSVYAQTQIKFYALWQYYFHTHGYIDKAQLQEQYYIAEVRKSNARLRGMTVEDIKNAYRKAYTQSPKT